MKFLLSFILVFLSLPSLATTSGWVHVKTGSLAAPGAIEPINIAQNFRLGVQTNILPSGAVFGISAKLYVSNDCVTYSPAPQKNAADSGVVQIVGGSGTYFLSTSDLSANCAEVYYNYTGGGILNIIEYKKVHTSDSQY